MSFAIQIGRSKSETNSINKSVTWIRTIEGTLKNETSIIDPEIMIEVKDEISLPSLTTCNYLYIERFKRYYFIRNVRSVRNNIAVISAHVDVLYTYGDEIKKNQGLILRSASNFSKMLDDGTFKIYSNPHIVTKKLTGETFASNPKFILAVSGS